MKISLDTSTGYFIVTGVDHPKIRSQGYVYYHRYLMEQKLGRELLPTEHIDHIDGDKTNNSYENLQILSNRKHQQKHRGEILPRDCTYCGAIFTPPTNNQKLCSEVCSARSQRRFEVTKDKLEPLLKRLPMEKIGKLFGVSGKAIAKRCDLLNIERPKRGSWTGRELTLEEALR